MPPPINLKFDIENLGSPQIKTIVQDLMALQKALDNVVKISKATAAAFLQNEKLKQAASRTTALQIKNDLAAQQVAYLKAKTAALQLASTQSANATQAVAYSRASVNAYKAQGVAQVAAAKAAGVAQVANQQAALVATRVTTAAINTQTATLLQQAAAQRLSNIPLGGGGGAGPSAVVGGGSGLSGVGGFASAILTPFRAALSVVRTLYTNVFSLRTLILGFGSTLAGRLVTRALQDFGEEEKAVIRLTVAMKNLGVFTQSALQRSIAFSNQLQKTTTFADEQTLQVQATLVSYGLFGDQLEQATLAALDFATASQTVEGAELSAVTAAVLLGKANFGVTNTLRRYGIIVGEDIIGTSKFDAVLRQVEQRFGGQASAKLLSHIGHYERFKNLLNELSEQLVKTFGSQLDRAEDAIIRVSDATIRWLNVNKEWINLNINRAVTLSQTAFASLKTTLDTTVASGQAAVTVFKTLGEGLSLLIPESIRALDLSTLWSGLKSAGGVLGDIGGLAFGAAGRMVSDQKANNVAASQMLVIQERFNTLYAKRLAMAAQAKTQGLGNALLVGMGSALASKFQGPPSPHVRNFAELAADEERHSKALKISEAAIEAESRLASIRLENKEKLLALDGSLGKFSEEELGRLQAGVRLEQLKTELAEKQSLLAAKQELFATHAEQGKGDSLVQDTIDRKSLEGDIAGIQEKIRGEMSAQASESTLLVRARAQIVAQGNVSLAQSHEELVNIQEQIAIELGGNRITSMERIRDAKLQTLAAEKAALEQEQSLVLPTSQKHLQIQQQLNALVTRRQGIELLTTHEIGEQARLLAQQAQSIRLMEQAGGAQRRLDILQQITALEVERNRLSPRGAFDIVERAELDNLEAQLRAQDNIVAKLRERAGQEQELADAMQKQLDLQTQLGLRVTTMAGRRATTPSDFSESLKTSQTITGALQSGFGGVQSLLTQIFGEEVANNKAIKFISTILTVSQSILSIIAAISAIDAAIPFQTGGMVSGGPPAPRSKFGNDAVRAVLHKGEMVVPKPFVGMVQDLIVGGGGGVGGGVNLEIINVLSDAVFSRFTKSRSGRRAIMNVVNESRSGA